MVVCMILILNLLSSFLHRYTIVFIVAFAITLIVCQIGGFMPWYMLFRTHTITYDCFYSSWLTFPVAAAIGFIFLLPSAIMTAIANVTMGKYILIVTLSWLYCLILGLNVITEFIADLIMPGDPIANVTFTTYAYIAQVQSLLFLSDWKLGHYMKVKSIDWYNRKKKRTISIKRTFSFRFLLVSCSSHKLLPLLLLVLSIWWLPCISSIQFQIFVQRKISNGDAQFQPLSIRLRSSGCYR